MPDGEVVKIFQVTEILGGSERSSFVDNPSIRPYRIAAGDYEHKVAACRKNETGIPECGKSSRKLTLAVPASVKQSLLTEPSSDQSASVETPISSAAIDGGPDELRPGQWYDPLKGGQGWSLYWANRLSLPESRINAIRETRVNGKKGTHPSVYF